MTERTLEDTYVLWHPTYRGEKKNTQRSGRFQQLGTVLFYLQGLYIEYLTLIINIIKTNFIDLVLAIIN